jgi:hypothetical protein
MATKSGRVKLFLLAAAFVAAVSAIGRWVI